MMLEEPIQIEEIECIIANLIMKKYIKGYLFKKDMYLMKRKKQYLVKEMHSHPYKKLIRNEF